MGNREFFQFRRYPQVYRSFASRKIERRGDTKLTVILKPEFSFASQLKKKLCEKNYLLDADWHTNFPRLQGGTSQWVP